ncbi:hypothetical protein ABTY63_15485 [Streptomyces solisilvae]
MLDQAHQLIEGAVVPRPDAVVAAARLARRLAIYAAEEATLART